MLKQGASSLRTRPGGALGQVAPRVEGVLYLSLCVAAVNAGDDRLSVSRNKKGEQFLASWCLGQTKISVLTIVRHDIRN